MMQAPERRCPQRGSGSHPVIQKNTVREKMAGKTAGTITNTGMFQLLVGGACGSNVREPPNAGRPWPTPIASSSAGSGNHSSVFCPEGPMEPESRREKSGRSRADSATRRYATPPLGELNAMTAFLKVVITTFFRGGGKEHCCEWVLTIYPEVRTAQLG